MGERALGECRCNVCLDKFTVRERTDYTKVLQHFLDKHPKSDGFAEVVADMTTKTECAECNNTFTTDVSVGWDRGETASLFVNSVCSDCTRNHPLKELYVGEVGPEQVVGGV